MIKWVRRRLGGWVTKYPTQLYTSCMAIVAPVPHSEHGYIIGHGYTIFRRRDDAGEKYGTFATPISSRSRTMSAANAKRAAVQMMKRKCYSGPPSLDPSEGHGVPEDYYAGPALGRSRKRKRR